MADHTEMIMHQLFLGIAKEDLALISRWAISSGFGNTTFQSNCQALLKYVKRFNLSWCATHPHTDSNEEGKSSSFGTGGWISETWIGHSRLLKCFVYFLEYKNDKKGGGPEMAPMMSFGWLWHRLHYLHA